MFCSACGTPRQREYRFCPKCGRRFEEAHANAGAILSPPASFGAAYEKQALLADARRVHERKYVSVLFADVCGSTEQVARFDPEEAQAFLDRALRLMTKAVEGYGGTISQLLGDGLLALFGAPFALEDHALRACLASIEMQRRAREEDASGLPLSLRVGIHSGEVLVGSVDHVFASHYRADGSTIHLAARLEKLARPGTVLLSGATARLAGEQIETVSLGPQGVRGLHGEVEVYELVTGALRSAAAPLARRRQIDRMVGRAAMLASLEAAASEVLSGQRRAVALSGEAGIGKSRLVAEFADGLAARGFAQKRVAAHSHTSHTSFRVVADLVRQLLNVAIDADAALQRESLRAAIAGWEQDHPLRRSALVDLLELGDVDARWAEQTPVQRRRHLADLVYWLVTRQLAAGPLLPVIEDLYLADRDSARLVEGLGARLEHMPVLFCFTYRQDVGRRPIEASWCTELVVPPLEADDMAILVGEMLGDHPSLDGVTAGLVERADGNPFFLEQLTITLIDNRTLVGTPRAYVCASPSAALSMPASITGVVASRVDRLPPAAKAALEAAAILGEPATRGVVAAMRQIPEEEADNHLLLAVSLGLLAAPEPADQPRYRFRHGLVQEVVVRALTRPRRKTLHRAAFFALEDPRGDASAERAALLVDHAYLGEEWAHAASLALKAMTRSIARSANRDALRVLELGMDAVQRLGGAPEAPQLELALCMASLGALLPLGRMDACVVNLMRAEALTELLGDGRREAAVALQLAVIRWTEGNYQLGLEAAGNAQTAAHAAGSRGVRMAAAQARLMLNHGLGRYDAVVSEARAVIADFGPEMGNKQVMPGWAVIASINVRAFLADALWRMDEMALAQQLCDECCDELARGDHHFSRVLVDFTQGQIWLSETRHDEAARLFKGALESCLKNDMPTMYPVFCAFLGAELGIAEREVGREVVLVVATAGRQGLPRPGMPMRSTRRRPRSRPLRRMASAATRRRRCSTSPGSRPPRGVRTWRSRISARPRRSRSSARCDGCGDPLFARDATSSRFSVPAVPVGSSIAGFEAFTAVRGGGYFFLPSLTVLRFLAAGPGAV